MLNKVTDVSTEKNSALEVKKIITKNVSQQFSALVEQRFSRRKFLNYSSKSVIALGVGATLQSNPLLSATFEKKESHFDFTEIAHGFSEDHLVSPGYSAEILIRWGDPIFPHSPVFNLNEQTPQSQEQQFGFNNDYIGYLTLPKRGQQEARALLCVNHEYPLDYMMFPELAVFEVSNSDIKNNVKKTLKHVEIEQSSVGNTILEIEKIKGIWQVVLASKYNRRITARTTEMEVSGPAAGNSRMVTSVDQTGKKVIGTLMNCAGGMTPWGTYLTCEENFNNVFTGSMDENHPEYRNYERYQINNRKTGWGEYDTRFNLASEPNEANRFGWVVEIDPKNPNAAPKKRTALGRFKHEGAECVVAPSGQLVVYMGDDAYFEYLYKFVSRDKVDLTQVNNNADLLDNGTLYVAKLSADGLVQWLPLIYGEGPLTRKHGFTSQADVVIEARYAADLLNATQMDRPEDVVPNKFTGKVYVILTNNKTRGVKQLDAVNTRANNQFGQIVEIDERGDFTATQSKWDMLLQAGDPSDPAVKAKWHPDTSKNGWFACPDGGVIDHQGRFWISTDQGSEVSKLTGTNDGLWAVETQGQLRGSAKMFYRGPNGAEVTGPQFSDDGKALFLSVQHPGVDEFSGGHNNLLSATSYWPDFTVGIPPRPSVVVIQNKKGLPIG